MFQAVWKSVFRRPLNVFSCRQQSHRQPAI